MSTSDPTSAPFAPAASVIPENFSVAAADHHERGRIRGQRLASGIASSIAAYAEYFAFLGIAETDVRSAADASFDALLAWDREAAEEVDAVAAGAGITRTALMSVIARTEIMTQAAEAPTECTTIGLSRTPWCTGDWKWASLAAQTWDWAADFSELWHINQVGAVPGQLAHVGFAEYGMLGKIGLNEAGVGVLLNILKHEGDGPGGVPIHMILERVLSRAGSLAEALALIHSAPTSSSSVITVVTEAEVAQVEIANPQKRERRAGSSWDGEELGQSGLGQGVLFHTNHFLHPDLLDGALELSPTSTSQARYSLLDTQFRQLDTLMGPGVDRELKESHLLALLTTDPDEAPISCIPAPDAPYGQRSATLVTVQIDPARKTIDIGSGSPFEGLPHSFRCQI